MRKGRLTYAGVLRCEPELIVWKVERERWAGFYELHYWARARTFTCFSRTPCPGFVGAMSDVTMGARSTAKVRATLPAGEIARATAASIILPVL